MPVVTQKLVKENPKLVAEILSTEKIYTIQDILNQIGVTRSTFYKYQKDGLIAEPYTAGNVKIWTKEMVEEFINKLNLPKRIEIKSDK